MPSTDEEGGGGGCSCCVWMLLGLLYLAILVLPTFLPPADLLANPNNLPTTCSVELTGFRGLQAATAPGATSPAFDLVVRVANGHDFLVSHGGGDVVVSYAGVPLARGRTPSFDVCAKETVVGKVNATSEGAVGVPEDLLRLLTEERRWGVAQLEIELKVAWESFACDVDLDGQTRSSACYKPTTIY